MRLAAAAASKCKVREQHRSPDSTKIRNANPNRKRPRNQNQNVVEVGEQRPNNSTNNYRTNRDEYSYSNNNYAQIVDRMFTFGRDLCFILACLFTVLALLTNSQFKPSRTPESRPFFSKSQWVTDTYGDDLNAAIAKSFNFDVTIMLLYSPWDAESQFIRKEFEATCKHYYMQIYCIAVNCWHLRGYCRLQFGHIPYYPIVIVDLHRSPTVNYNGIFDSSHMIKFISSIIYPLQRITTLKQFRSLRNIKDAVIITFIPMSLKYLYAIYYLTSQKYLELDPRQEICWCIVTDKFLAEKLKLHVGTIKIHLWNETYEYNGKFERKDITVWVYNRARFLTRWHHSNYRNRPSLPSIIDNSVALILFTPRNMFMDINPLYLLLREVAMDIYNCKNTSWIKKQSRYIERKRRGVLESLKSLTRYCRTEDVSVNLCTFLVNQYFNEKDEMDCADNYQAMAVQQFNNSSVPLNGAELPAVDSSSTRNLVYSNCVQRCNTIRMMDKRFNYSKELREKIRTGNTNEDNIGKRSLLDSDNHNDSLTGLGCKLDYKISFIAIDSLLNSEYADALGINLNNYTDRTVFLILDQKEENVHVLPMDTIDKPIILKYLRDFINFKLPRWHKSTENSPVHLYQNADKNKSSFHVAELNSQTFQSVVFDHTQHVVVYYYSPFCTYCQVVAHEFLQVAYTCRHFSDRIKFVRIDGENNDLPWHLTVPKYPTLAIFPARRKEESRFFPISTEFNSNNILEFILKNIDTETSLQIMIDLCLKDQFLQNDESKNDSVIEKCILQLKNRCLSKIGYISERYTKLVMEASSKKINLTENFERLLENLRYYKKICFYLHNPPISDYASFLSAIKDISANNWNNNHDHNSTFSSNNNISVTLTTAKNQQL